MARPAEQTDDGGGLVKPFIEHLDDLRTTVIRCALAVLAGMVIAVPLAPGVIALLKEPLARAGADPEQLLRITEIGGGFTIAMQVILLTGLIISMPLLIVFVCQFIFPGLTVKERGAVTRGLLAVSLLFAGGVIVGYFLVLPAALRMLLQTNEWIQLEPGPITIASHASFCLLLLLGFGISFELPAVLVVLGSLGLVSAAFLRAKRRHAIVIILLIAMVLTPPDVFSQLLMAIPLLALYEISILIIRMRERTRAT